MITRRQVLGAVTCGMVAGGVGSTWLLARAGSNGPEAFEVSRSEAEWRRLLDPEAFAVLREESTEPRYSSPLLNEKRAGTYHCAGCDLAAYDSKAKFDSGTGWPSFYEALPNAVRTKADFSLLWPRTEVHCRRCGGHFGHIFDDGPPPTGKRHCLNGLALTFRPAASAPAS